MYTKANGNVEYDIGDEVQVCFIGMVVKKEKLGGEFWYQVDGLTGTCATAKRLEAKELCELPTEQK